MDMRFSVIIPACGRIGPLKFTLNSVRRSLYSFGNCGEVVLVDDGSEEPLAREDLLKKSDNQIRILRKENGGSISARLAGLKEARGDVVLFLDSDDLIHPAKLDAHYAAHSREDVDAVYDDISEVRLLENYEAEFTGGWTLPLAKNGIDLLLKIQPLPHGISFKRSYLLKTLEEPLIPPFRKFDWVGDVWNYYNMLIAPPRFAKIHRPLTAVGPHTDFRFSRNWERLAVEALLLVEAFVQRCPIEPSTIEARIAVGETAFDSWRRLPRDFPPVFADRLLSVWRHSPRGPIKCLGGKWFSFLAALVGPEMAAKIMKLRNHSYSSCRTIDPTALKKLLTRLDSHESLW
ncbi:MAG: glycosyltransferase family 2 protein [Candidatus Didemnitutus sp.]|nr:glycosyltransferase family 2 protein [Candidatus Didemnitutus sp.]